MTTTTYPILDAAAVAATFSRENTSESGVLAWVPVGRVYDNPFQVRLAYDDAHIERLVDSIWSLRDELPETNGLQQPPVARVMQYGPDGDATAVERSAYADPAALRRRLTENGITVELHFGHNRLRAWRQLRTRDTDAYAAFPVFLAYADDQAMWRHAVTENAQRKDISPIEEAAALKLAIERFGMTLEAAGAPFGFAKSTVSNKIRLMGLPETLRQEIQAGRLTERHGRALLRLAPAPHLWEEFDLDDLLDTSVVQLERMVAKLIANQRPLAPQPHTGYARFEERWNGTVDQRTDQYDPEPWPYDWTPAQADSRIHGACIGCTYRVTFAGEAGARCTEPDAMCRPKKHEAWRREQAAAQAAALEDTRLRSVHAGAVAAVTTDQVAAPPSTPVKAPDENVRESEICWFDQKYGYSTPAALVDKGLCSAERCECFVLAFNSRAGKEHLRPDPEHAPNMCYGCTSKHRLDRRRKELEVGDLTEHRKRVKAEQEEAERLLSEAFADYRADEIWHNRVVVVAIAKGNIDVERRYDINDSYDLATIQEKIFKGIAWSACRQWNGSSTAIWNVEKVRTWLHDVATAAGRIAPQIGMVEDEPAVQP